MGEKEKMEKATIYDAILIATKLYNKYDSEFKDVLEIKDINQMNVAMGRHLGKCAAMSELLKELTELIK